MTESVEEPRLPSPEERRGLREAAGLTYEAVATAVGVRASTVRSWESGRTHPRGRKREAYAAFLNSLAPASAEPGAAPAAAAGGARTAPTAAAPRGPVAASAEVPGAAPSAGAPDPAGVVADGTPADGAAMRMPGAMRPFGMSGHGPRTRPPVAAKRAARPPTGVPRHEARFTVRATARAIGTPGLATPGPAAPLPLPCPAPAGAEAAATAAPEASGPESHGPAPGEAPGQAPTGATTAGPGSPAAGTTTATPQAHGHAAAGTPPHPAPTAEATAAEATAADSDRAEPAPEEPGRAAAAAGPPGPGAVFDALYQYAAPALARQAYLLTGRRRLAEEAVERAFQQAWARWPEVAVDPDPVGWVRAAAYEYALSPWHGLRRAHKHPDKAPAAPADRILMDAMLALPPAHRRTVLLYDGVGLDLPDTAAETEASTPTTGNRLLHAHAALADRIPELAAAPAEKQSAVLRERLGAVIPAVPLEPRPAAAVRFAAEYRATRWTRAFLGLTAVIAVATAYTTATAPRQYEPPIAPGASVSGVPPLAGPQRLTDETRLLRERLRAHPAHRPERLAPSLE
ncbi:helix-turn-helix domain-containing protein [Streptomyces sp. NRRL S-244]|uniref:helix-turn-helix domain-containing protein n=1 Tax=Streptomyces sp. NRRL S-244 TaxID=1463897 RepID=UPI0004BF80EC|nr:helix-turn-helix domain-containing protein [Streptomyces sp. NRRL S-244]